MSEELKPCPFCGGEAEMEEIKGGFYSSWSVGCRSMEGPDECIGQQSLLSFARKCEAIAAWNRRAPMTAPTPAGEENVTEDIAAFCDACAESSERHLFVDRAKAFRAAAQSIRSGLLSSPRVEEVRREAFGEAAAIAEQPYSDAVMAFGPDEPFAVGRKIAAAIRSLSPTNGARQPIHQRSGPHK